MVLSSLMWPEASALPDSPALFWQQAYQAGGCGIMIWVKMRGYRRIIP
jgi:hypothetical protein